jgi:hypothetical protein
LLAGSDYVVPAARLPATARAAATRAASPSPSATLIAWGAVITPSEIAAVPPDFVTVLTTKGLLATKRIIWAPGATKPTIVSYGNAKAFRISGYLSGASMTSRNC